MPELNLLHSPVESLVPSSEAFRPRPTDATLKLAIAELLGYVYLLSTLPLLSFLHSTLKSWHCCRSQPATNFNLQKLLQSNQLFSKSTRIKHIARNAGPHYSRPSFRVCVVFQLSKSTVLCMFPRVLKTHVLLSRREGRPVLIV
jgi:hypothetical protein